MTRWIVATLLLAALPCAAQYEDPSDRDHEKRDQRYFERQSRADRDTVRDEDAAAAAYVTRAEELIRDRHYRSGAGGAYRVQTDDPRLRPDAVVELLNGFRDFFEEFWSAETTLRGDEEETTRAFLFYSFAKYNQLLEGDYRRRSLRPKGHYGSTSGVIVVHTDADQPAGLADTLIHESAHQLVDRLLYGEDASPSPWVAEGLASVFGYTFADKDGRFVPGKIGGKHAQLFRDKVRGSSYEPRLRLKAFRNELKAAGPEDELLFDWLITIDDPAIFYDVHPRVTYGASWVLAHFLLYAEEGRYRAGFARFLAADAEGAGTPTRLYEEIGLDPEGLERAVRTYVAGLKTH